ncbi:AMP-binding protein [Ralstonia pseudosolanacearum]|uniref:Putative Novobiocin biosynthesis protein H n=1 Tax=Ralstonia solanacearum TaxID=305 RepID=A0A0S4TZ56_RALSL|nr:putative Novobiocin biosynthesis protein H [Ralstonia solanacearum]
MHDNDRLHDAGSATEHGTNLARRFYQQALAAPDRTALVIDGERWSYGDLRAAALRLSDLAMRSIGRSPDAEPEPTPPLMAALGSRQATQYLASLAAPMGGWIYMPLFAGDPVSRIVQVLDRERPPVLVVDPFGAALLPDILPRLDFALQVIGPDSDDLAIPMPHRFHGWRALSDMQARDTEPAPCSASTVAYLLFTSGSTGVPKGVPITHGNLMTFVESAALRLAPTAEDRFGQISNLSWDVSILESHVAWAVGASVHRLPDQLIRIPAYIRAQRLTHWFSTPSVAVMLQDLHALQPSALASLKCSVFAGEALPASLVRQWHEAAPNSLIENFYGPTEASVAIACHRWHPSTGDAEFIPFGEPFPGQTLVACDEHGEPVTDGTIGELYLSGSQVAVGYWNNPEESARRFVRAPDGRLWYRTGDQAVHTACGWRFVGRVDDQLKVQGYRVERLEIEAMLRKAAGTQNAVIVMLPLNDQSSILTIHGVVANGSLDSIAILRRCRELMPAHMVPTAIHLRDIPRTSSGKADYGRLRALLLDTSPAPDTMRGAVQ